MSTDFHNIWQMNTVGNLQKKGGLSIPPIRPTTNKCYRSDVVCRSSVTLVYLAKAAGRNEMPRCQDGKGTHVIQINIVLDRGPAPTGRGDLGVETPSWQRCRLLHMTLAVVVIKLKNRLKTGFVANR